MASERTLEIQRETNAMLATMNPIIFGRHSRLKLWYVLYENIREQDINANVMPVEMFNQLVSNVRNAGALESLPLMATRSETPEVVEIVSGHHRTRAAKQAGLEGGVVLLYEGLTNSELRAKQLAHNSIAGKSDPEIVKAIFQQIQSIESQMESYIDPNQFDEIPTSISFKMVDIDPLEDAKTVTVVFLPTQVADFKTAVDLLSSKPDEVYLARREDFDNFREAVQKTQEQLTVVAVPTAIAAMARLALERLAQLKAARDAAGPDALVEIPAARIDPDVLAALTSD